MVTDYEAAWVELQALVGSKTQHGREALLAEMARIQRECRVPAGELSRLLRLYGVEVERARSVSAETGRDDPEGFGGGFGSPADRGFPGHHRPEGGHDGNSNGRREAVS